MSPHLQLLLTGIGILTVFWLVFMIGWYAAQADDPPGFLLFIFVATILIVNCLGLGLILKAMAQAFFP